MASPGFGVRGHDDRGAEGASIEAPKAPSGLGYGEGFLLPSRLGSPGERRELPQRGPGRSRSGYRIFCILLTHTVETACRDDVSLQLQRCAKNCNIVKLRIA